MAGLPLKHDEAAKAYPQTSEDSRDLPQHQEVGESPPFFECKDCGCTGLGVTVEFRTESRIDCSDARQSMLIPATWMIPLNGSLPAEVSTAPPNGIGPCFRSSLEGPVPPCFLIAPETPWGSSSPQGLSPVCQACLPT